MHIGDGAWCLIESWQSEVSLFKYVFLIELGNRDHVGSLPSVVHDSRKGLLTLVFSFSGAIGCECVGAMEVGAHGADIVVGESPVDGVGAV